MCPEQDRKPQLGKRTREETFRKGGRKMRTGKYLDIVLSWC
jgi:hypothetical protein